MRILVAGGAGYVGGAVTDLLMQGSHEVRVLDALLYEEAYRKPAPFVRADVRDTQALRRHLDWADGVIWLAALVGDGACALNPDISEAINHRAVQQLTRLYDGRIVFASTCSVYGAQDSVLTEQSPVRPLSVYARTKLQAEAELADKNALVFRFGTLYGIGDQYSRIRLDLVVNSLTVRACTARRIRVFGGEQYRPLLHVRDAARALVMAVEQSHRGIFNLHSVNVRIGDLARAICGHFRDVAIDYTELPFEDTRNYQVSSALAIERLGFRPILTVDDGVEELRTLVETGRIRDLSNPRYANQEYLGKFATHLDGPVVAS